MAPRVRRGVRVGDGKFSFSPNDTDHNGWLLLSSTARMVNKTDYPALYAALGITYGGTLGGTTFGLPPAGGKFLLSMGNSHALGSVGGAERVTLSVNELPEHKHTIPKVNVADTASQLALLTSVLGIALGSISKPPTVTISGTQDTSNAGSGASHENMPPFITVNVFIFAGLPLT